MGDTTVLVDRRLDKELTDREEKLDKEPKDDTDDRSDIDTKEDMEEKADIDEAADIVDAVESLLDLDLDLDLRDKLVKEDDILLLEERLLWFEGCRPLVFRGVNSENLGLSTTLMTPSSLCGVSSGMSSMAAVGSSKIIGIVLKPSVPNPSGLTSSTEVRSVLLGSELDSLFDFSCSVAGLLIS